MLGSQPGAPSAIQRVLTRLRGETPRQRGRGVPPDQHERMRALFMLVFASEPDEGARKTLEFLAQDSGSLSDSQALRRVVASFDQQRYSTSLTVRWGPEDLLQTSMFGLRLYLDGADVSVSHPIARGEYERHIVRFFSDFLKPGMTVVDAGANIGLYTVLAGKLVGPTGAVWSFEPNSENCRLLLASVQENGLDNVQLQPLALGSTRGFTYFTSALGSNGGLLEGPKRNLMHPSCKIVPISMLDDFDLPRIDLLKMDVEGAEALLVQGAERTLARCKPTIAMEFSHEMLNRISGVKGGDFLDAFRRRGYAVFLLDKVSHELCAIEDVYAFDKEFEGTGRLEDLVLMPERR